MGIPRSGKTITSIKMAKMLNYNYVAIDTVYEKIAKELGLNIDDAGNPKIWKEIPEIDKLKEKYYAEIVTDKPTVYDGFGLCFEKDRQLIKDNGPIFYLPVSYEDWLMRTGYIIGNEIKPTDINRKEYDSLNRMIEFPQDYYTVDKVDILEDISAYRDYQSGRGKYGVNFIPEKYKRLKLKPMGKTIIDLGGNAGGIDELAIKDGAIEATVVDKSWQHLEEAKKKGLKTVLFNLNYLEEFNLKADIVVCTSTIHYIQDQNKFIKNCARIAKNLVLELPLSEYTGKKLQLNEPFGTFKPTKEYIENILNRYYEKVELVGDSIAPDDSNRVVYHCSNF